jgi:hypothetical protein
LLVNRLATMEVSPERGRSGRTAGLHGEELSFGEASGLGELGGGEGFVEAGVHGWLLSIAFT